MQNWWQFKKVRNLLKKLLKQTKPKSKVKTNLGAMKVYPDSSKLSGFSVSESAKTVLQDEISDL